MPTYEDKITNILISSVNITTTTNAIYINPLVDFAPLGSADPSIKLEPPPGTETTETTRFTRYILLAYTSQAKNIFVAVGIGGIGHIYVDSVVNSTFYYKAYAKLVKTKDFTTFTDVTSEVTIMNYSRNNASSEGWYDDGYIGGSLRAKTLLNDEALLLVIRGTSWGSGAVKSSIGINSTNLKVFATVLA